MVTGNCRSPTGETDNQGEYMKKNEVENQKAHGASEHKTPVPEWFEEYKQRKIDREAEETLEIEIPLETPPDSE